MTRTRRTAGALVALAVVSLAVPLAKPSTLWILSELVRMLTTQPTQFVSLFEDLGIKELPPAVSFALPAGDQSDAAMVAEARLHPTDFPMQLAAAKLSPPQNVQSWGSSVATGLRMLSPRFPDRPSLLAGILRYETLGNIHIRRKEEAFWQPRGQPSFGPQISILPNPKLFGAFNACAAAGERVDPENAYFPAMRAVGLFGSQQDKEALAALGRAAGKPYWREYLEDEVNGAQRLAKSGLGERGSVKKVLRVMAVTFPHYAQLRAAARMAVYRAVQLEKSGRGQDALAIRHNVMALGAKMRAQSVYAVGSLVGSAIAGIAGEKPNGYEIVGSAFLSDENNIAQRQQAYLSYLRRLGRPSEAIIADRQYSASRTVRAIDEKAIDRGCTLAGNGLIRLCELWIAALVALVAFVWLATMAAVAGIVSRKEQLGAAGAMAAVILGFALLAPLSYQVMRHGAGFAAVRSIAYDFRSNTLGHPREEPSAAPALLAIGGVPAIAFTACGIALISAVVQRRRFAASMARGLGAAACIVLLFLCAQSIRIASAERQMSAAIDQTIAGEGRFLAKQVGETWPAE